MSTRGAGPPSQFASSTQELQWVRHNHGRRAGSSNRAAVPLAPVLPAKNLHSELDARGVYLIWETEEEPESRSSLVKFDYRIYRREKGSSKRIAVSYLRAVIHTPDGERWSAVDMDIDWEKTYLYTVTPVTRMYSQEGHLIAEIEGDDPAPLEVTTHDVFAPAVPEGLLPIVGHISEKKFVDLIWSPNKEKDLSGYNVYRRKENGQPARVNSLPITMVSFQDVNLPAGHKFFYCISAVDVRGNESAKSPEATAVVP
jgi:fibronectin type 3 domain-containing protein